jgi:hypothetical protein
MRKVLQNSSFLQRFSMFRVPGMAKVELKHALAHASGYPAANRNISFHPE